MAETFLLLSRDDRAELLNALASELGRAPAVLEKDVWVCWVLAELFKMPGALPMAFKGGTSLSKIFDAIHRFSEDVDITISYRSLEDTDPFALTRSQQRKLSERLKENVDQHLRGTVVPQLSKALTAAFADPGANVERVDEETVRIVYPTAAGSSGGYISDSVKIEFGGRNSTEPQEKHTVTPYMADRIPSLEFPVASACVLAPARTFWEKATLMHVECGRGDPAPSVQRKSRHWYDLAMLADGPIGKNAIGQRGLLEDVVKHKKVFFGSAKANYEACLNGGLRLVPDGPLLDALRLDYRAMREAGMFYQEPPPFDEIVARLRQLEASINAAAA